MNFRYFIGDFRTPGCVSISSELRKGIQIRLAKRIADLMFWPLSERTFKVTVELDYRAERIRIQLYKAPEGSTGRDAANVCPARVTSTNVIISWKDVPSFASIPVQDFTAVEDWALDPQLGLVIGLPTSFSGMEAAA